MFPTKKKEFTITYYYIKYFCYENRGGIYNSKGGEIINNPIFKLSSIIQVNDLGEKLSVLGSWFKEQE